MEYFANVGKKVEITVGEKVFKRHAIQTEFINQGESYVDVFEKYVLPYYKEGDIISASEKIISLCQNRTIKRDDVKIGFFAKLLSGFASKPDTGIGVGETIKMQYAIDKVGLIRVIFASICSAITKLFKIKGVFYKIVGQEVSGLDGFYAGVWDEYKDLGIELPEDPNGVCNEIKEKLNISCMIVDANDLGVEILGVSDDITYDLEYLKQLIIDNPAGQSKQLTPLILIRENWEN